MQRKLSLFNFRKIASKLFHETMFAFEERYRFEIFFNGFLQLLFLSLYESTKFQWYQIMWMVMLGRNRKFCNIRIFEAMNENVAYQGQAISNHGKTEVHLSSRLLGHKFNFSQVRNAKKRFPFQSSFSFQKLAKSKLDQYGWQDSFCQDFYTNSFTQCKSVSWKANFKL